MMVMSTNLLIAGLLVCLLCVHTVSSDNDVLKYEINSVNYIHLEPDPVRTLLRINSDLYIRLNKNLKIKNEYFISLRNTELSIEKENSKSLNLRTCLTMAIPSISLLKPFAAVYDDNGLLKYITVHKDETDLSVNFKLLASSLLQVNRTILGMPNSPENYTENSEPTLVGDCPVYYNVEKRNQSKIEVFWIEKYYDMNLCTDLKNNNNGSNVSVGQSKDICRNDTQKELYWKRKADMIATKKKKSTYIQYVTLTENIRYLPWKNSSKEAFMESSTSVTLVTTANSLVYPYFLDVNSKNVTRLSYRDVDTSIIENIEEAKDVDLQETYKALACESKTENIYMELYEKAINCWKTL